MLFSDLLIYIVVKLLFFMSRQSSREGHVSPPQPTQASSPKLPAAVGVLRPGRHEPMADTVRGHRFNPHKLPCAREIMGQSQWRPEHRGYPLGHPTAHLRCGHHRQRQNGAQGACGGQPRLRPQPKTTYRDRQAGAVRAACQRFYPLHRQIPAHSLVVLRHMV